MTRIIMPEQPSFNRATKSNEIKQKELEQAGQFLDIEAKKIEAWKRQLGNQEEIECRRRSELAIEFGIKAYEALPDERKKEIKALEFISNSAIHFLEGIRKNADIEMNFYSKRPEFSQIENEAQEDDGNMSIEEEMQQK